MYKLVINSEQAELSTKTTIELNKELFKFGDISSRGVLFTNAINLPFTALNNRICGHPSRLASDNMAFEETQRYELLDDSGIVSRGELIVKEFSEVSGIKVQLIEGYGFWSLAGKRTLKDLIIHEDDFVFNTANMNALKAKTSSVFLTALHSATGDDANTALVDYNYTRPAYRFDIILDKMISELGYTVDYDNIYSVTNLNLLGCLSNTKAFYISDFKRRFENVSTIGDITISAGTNIFAKAGNVALVGDTLVNNLYKTSYVFKGWVDSPVNTQILFTFGTKVERVLVSAGRSFVNFRSDEVEIGSALTISTSAIILLEDVYIYSAISENDIFGITKTVNIDDYLVLADYNLPEQTYKVFIKNLFKLAFINTDIDEAKKEIKFSYLPSKISTNNALDLSANVIKKPTTKGGNIYGQLNVMRYANDEDLNPNLGTAFFNVENKSAVESKIFLEISSYSSSNEITAAGENIMVCSIYDVAEQKRSSVKDRIVYFDETGAFGFNAIFNAVSFQRIFSDVYAPFIEATKRERSQNISVFLSKLQFKQLNEFPLIYIDSFKSHFLVGGISGFNKDKPATLTTVKYN